MEERSPKSPRLRKLMGDNAYGAQRCEDLLVEAIDAKKDRGSVPVQLAVRCVDRFDRSGRLIEAGCGSSFFVFYPSTWTTAQLEMVLNSIYGDHKHHKPMSTLDLAEGVGNGIDYNEVKSDIKAHPPIIGRPSKIKGD